MFEEAHYEGTVISWAILCLGDELLRQAADAKSAVLIVEVGRADVATVEAQVVRVVATVRRLRPVEAVATSTADRRAVDVAGVEEIVRISTKYSRSV